MAYKKSNRVTFEPDVKIVTNKMQNSKLGYSISVVFKNGSEKLYFDPAKKVELWVKGPNRIVFRQDREGRGNKIGILGASNIGFKMTNTEIIPNILPFCGSYKFHKDELRGYYYIDKENQSGHDDLIRMANSSPEEARAIDKQVADPNVITMESVQPLRIFDAVPKSELKKVQEELEFQKNYNEELERDISKLKEDVEYYKGLLKDAPGLEKNKIRNLCIEYMRKRIDDMEYNEAHAVNDLITAIF